jgi:hypothetical protein
MRAVGLIAGNGTKLVALPVLPKKTGRRHFPQVIGDSGEAERLFRKQTERHSGMIPNTTGA